ncbi:MAG: hypothetical protein P8I62_00430 [Pseudomonadales bacterium]|nr:hypothetical protein [Pseudomonadales bacterium]
MFYQLFRCYGFGGKKIALSILLTLGSLLLVSCGSAPTIDPSTEIEIDKPPVDRGLRLPPRATDKEGMRLEKSASAVDQLLVQANTAIAEKTLGKASALVERAIRVAPQDPRAYFSLAQIRYRQGQQGQAKSLAQRARALAGNDTALLASIVQFQKSIR